VRPIVLSAGIVIVSAVAAACGESSIELATTTCLTAEAAVEEASAEAGVPAWGSGASGAGDLLISHEARIADDMGALRRLEPNALPLAGVCAVKDLARANRAGRVLVEEARLLVETEGRRVYVVPTSHGDVCGYLDPQGIPNCSGFFRKQPRLYPFYYYDDGLPRAQRRLVVFGLVPDKVRQVNVLVRCRTKRAVTANGGFYYEGRGASAKDLNGFVFRLRNGTAKRQTFGVTRLEGTRRFVRACSR
jgi:hypothetical protein